MKRLLTLVIIFINISSSILANEGMWLPFLINRLNYEDMQKNGLKLTAEEIYSVNKSSIKDAIVKMNGGSCTGEIISAQGLFLTNHHCGYDVVQGFSSKEHDYLTNGFWAMNKSEEKPVPDFFIELLVRIEDHTKEVKDFIKDAKDSKQRMELIKEISAKIEKEATEGNHYNATLESFFYDNEFYLFVKEQYDDIRLVGTPPESIGKYGGDEDNWMWPRHTGDFNLFRIYTGKDGKPAPYSKDNIPLNPKHHLPISLKGIKENDFAMIMGYPGSTDRYLTSKGVDNLMKYKAANTVSIREKRQEAMKKHMDSDVTVRIKYASKYAQSSNYWKYFIGQNEQLKNNNVIDTKTEYEKRFKEWYESDNERNKKYKDVLSNIDDIYNKLSVSEKSKNYNLEAGLVGMGTVLYSVRIYRTLDMFYGTIQEMDKMIKESDNKEAKEELKKQKQDFSNNLYEKLVEEKDNFFKDYDKATELDITNAMLNMYYKDVDAKFHPNFFSKSDNGDFSKLTNQMFSKSCMTNNKSISKLLKKMKKGKDIRKKLEDDITVQVGNEILDKYLGDESQELEEALDEQYRILVEGYREMDKDKIFYPNANSTQRLTYGTVQPYKVSESVKKIIRSKDGIDSYFTTLEGAIEKEVTDKNASNYVDFQIPTKLKELYTSKDYGQYADKDGTLHLCFLTDNDITGGNSGSPVINGLGQLIGTAFDGNWEAMSGDISFEKSVQRTISVDIRYTLFIIDKFAGAGHLIEEMTLIK